MLAFSAPLEVPPEIALVARFTQTVPVDIRGLASALALRVELAPLGPDLSSRLERDGQDWLLTANAAHEEARLRFTVARAIAHLILHGDLFAAPVTADDRYHSPDLPEAVERQASDYAADILLPWRSFKPIWDADGLTAAAKRFGVETALARRHHERVMAAAAQAKSDVLFPGAPETEGERLLATAIAVLAKAKRALVATQQQIECAGPEVGPSRAEAIEAIDALFRDFAPWATDRLRRRARSAPAETAKH